MVGELKFRPSGLGWIIEYIDLAKPENEASGRVVQSPIKLVLTNPG